MSNDTATVTLAEFLLARIAEDEHYWRPVLGDLEEVAQRLLIDCEAKRRIVAEHPDYGGYGERCATCAESDIDLVKWPCPTLRALALPYADHPDYRKEWAL